MVSPVQVLDSLGGRSSLVRDVTMEMGPSEVVLLTVLAIWPMRSSTQPADNRASASWSQHSSMVSHIWLRPWRQQAKLSDPWRQMYVYSVTAELLWPACFNLHSVLQKPALFIQITLITTCVFVFLMYQSLSVAVANLWLWWWEKKMTCVGVCVIVRAT